MKKYGLLFALIATLGLVPLSSNQLVFKGGLNLSDNSGLTMFNQPLEFYGKTYLSFAGGVHYRLDFGPYLAFQPEILYLQKHTKYVLKDLNTIFKLDYIETPLLFKVHLYHHQRKVVPFIFAGPYLSFPLQGEQLFITAEDSYAVKFEQEIDYGITAGAGLDFNLRSLTILLEARYYYGMAELNNASTAKTSGFCFMAGIGIH